MADSHDFADTPVGSRESWTYLLEIGLFDPRERRLILEGREVPLQPKTCETLLYLVERAGRLVEKRELLESLWEGVYVTEHALTRSIKELRRALGDDARNPRFIATVPRVGYRFVGAVRREPRHEVGAAAVPASTGSVGGSKDPADDSTKPRARPGAPSPMRVIAWTGLAGAALLLAFLFLSGAPGDRDTEAPGPRSEERKMLVVLPFENLGLPEDAYFAAGMTDELTSRLARVSSLGVISRTTARRYSGDLAALPLLEEELGVAYVIEGTVRWARGGGGSSRLRITPKLVRVADQTQLWSGTYDRDLEDVFSIQADIATRVIDELDIALAPSERAGFAQRPTENVDAYQAWLKGLDQWYVAGFDLGRFSLAAELFERAAELDPGFVEPLATLVRVYGVAFNAVGDPRLREKMRRALERAEALSPDAPEVELARCAWLQYSEQRYDEAFERCAAASRRLSLQPEPVEMMAYIRRRQGRPEETVQLLEQVLSLSPRDAHTHYELALTLEGLRRFEAADAHYESASRLEPQNTAVFFDRAFLRLRWQGDIGAAVAIAVRAPNAEAAGGTGLSPVEALDVVRRDWQAIRRRFEERALRPGDPSAIPYGYYARTYEELGEPRMAAEVRQRLLEFARARASKSPDSLDALIDLSTAEALTGSGERALTAADRARDLVEPIRFLAPFVEEVRAFALVQLGRRDEAIDIIEKLLQAHYQRPLTVPLLAVHPDWDPLRGHPRFERLLARTE